MTTRGSNRREREDGLVENQVNVGEDADVVLDVPMLNIEELDLEVDDLRAHVAARAQLANFVNINVGVDVYLDKVKLEIKGVEAQVLLKVKLERILGTIERALSAIEQNPGLLDSALREVNQAAGEIEGTVGGADETPQGATDESESAAGPEKDEGTAEGSATEVEATDAARRKAEELGMDLSQIEGTGAGGRVLVRDVKKAAR